MKDFLKYVFATVTGLVIVCLLMVFISIISIIGMASMNTTTVSIRDNSVMVLKLDGSIEERSQDNPFASLLGDSFGTNAIGLDDITTAIKAATENDNIKGIYIEAGNLSGATPAMLEAIHTELATFKKSGKFIVSYGDNYSQGEYYLCSLADSILINHDGMISWTGMASQVLYYKDILDKLGVKMQIFKVGTYKSAVEPYFLNEMSDANREQLSVMQQEIWGKFCESVSKSRGISVAKLNAIADSAAIFMPTSSYKQLHLVDKIIYADDVPNVITRMAKVDEPDDYHTINFTDVAANANNTPKDGSDNQIAVYYACGEIVQESSDNGLNYSQEPTIVGSQVIRDLKELADDDDVKAVVLRVNSPGGSAYASEQIWHQVMNIKAHKPIIVSMGGYAASGGYYISCAADWIVAEPTTLTGSIGIFGMFPEASELLEKKIGVHSQVVTTNKYGDFGNYFRPMNADESIALQSYINRGYEQFTKRCADGRHISQDSIKVIGEGRVWTGLHALKIGLVDQLGNLDDAIAVAKKKAKISEYHIVNYPAKPSVFEQLLEEVQSGSYADAQLSNTFGEYYDIFRSVRQMTSESGIQAVMPYRLTFNL